MNKFKGRYIRFDELRNPFMFNRHYTQKERAV